MKKLSITTRLLTLSIIAVSLLSCGGNKGKQVTTVTVKPKTTVIKGDLGDYYQVVDKNYQVKLLNVELKDTIYQIVVEIMRNDKKFPFSTDKVQRVGISGDVDYNFGFGIELYGDGDPVIRNASEHGNLGDNDDDITGLIHLKSGETGFIHYGITANIAGLKTFQVTSLLLKSNNPSISNEIPSEGTAVVVVSKAYYYKDPDTATKRKAFNIEGDKVKYNKLQEDFVYASYDNGKGGVTEGWMKKSDLKFPQTHGTTDALSSTATTSVDCDEFLRDYEAFVDSYIKLLKKYKANPTDPTILNEYTDAAQKALDMQNKAANCSDPKYASKLLELNNKLSQAALELTK